MCNMRRSRGVHLGKVIWVAAFLDVVDGVFGVLAEVLGALGFEAVHVEGDTVVVARFQVEDLGGDVLERNEEFRHRGR